MELIYYSHLLPIASISTLSLFSAYLFLHRHAHRSIFALFFFSITVTIWQLDLYGLVISKDVHFLHVWRRLPRMATMMLAPMMLNFVYSLINKNKKDLLYIFSFLIGSYFAIYRLIFYTADSYTKRALFWVPDKAPLLIAYFVFTYGLFFVALILLIKNAFKTKDIIFKKQLILIFLALFSYVFFNLDVLPVVINQHRIQFLGSISAVFFIMFSAYIITKHDVFDVKLVITGTSVRLISSIFEKIINIYKRDEALDCLLDQLHTILNLNIYNIVKASRNKNLEIIKYLSNEEISIPSDHQLIAFLNNSRRPLLFDEIKNSPPLLNQLNFSKGSLLLPIYSSKNLEYLIFIQPDKDNITFNKKDLKTFQLIINQMIPILDRIEPYEKIKAEYQATLKKLDDVKWQLARTEKIASLARITEACHHEVRTPISNINLSLQNLSDDASPEKIKNYKKNVQTQIERLFYIVNTSLDLTYSKEKLKTSINLNKVIKESIQLVPPDGYELSTKLQNIPDITGVKGDLITVFVNLIDNAKKAMIENGGTLLIKTYLDDGYIITEVSDTGLGINIDILEKIWEPYFTTDLANGHGLGLSTVHQIVQKHNAKITVKSTIGTGTIFKIAFPLADRR